MRTIEYIMLGERGQTSLEFILLVGGVVIGALTLYLMRDSVVAFANVTKDWIALERNKTIEIVTR